MIDGNIKLSFLLPPIEFVFLESLAPLFLLMHFEHLGFPFHPVVEEVADLLLVEGGVVVGNTSFLYHPLEFMDWEVDIDGLVYLHFVDLAVVVVDLSIVLLHDVPEVVN